MKKMIAGLFIALATIVGMPGFGMAHTNSALGIVTAFAGYRVSGRTTQTHQVYLYAGHVHVSISGDGDTDLDLYVRDGFGNIVSRNESYIDDETACLNVYGPGYFTVQVVNRGKVYNDYSLKVEYK